MSELSSELYECISVAVGKFAASRRPPDEPSIAFTRFPHFGEGSSTRMDLIESEATGLMDGCSGFSAPEKRLGNRDT